MIESIQQFDADLFLKIHRGWSNDFLDFFFPLVRNRYFWAPLYLFIIIFFIKEYKKTGYYLLGIFLLTFGLGDLTASRLIKPFVARLRPCNEPTLALDIIHRVPCGSGYSFPSAHATNHFALAVFIICVFYPKWKPILPIGLAWAIMISLAQIYVGVHYPVDVMTGTLLGCSIGLLTARLFKTLKPEF
ncbi:phosphatase PAP2 family protein [Pedobacter sp. SYP-B3415]|uniref:phosphatase PAP2 family protein n=1 Tax=Pedobacter sp. SYP-B3415 TaxID=2496641 RepID=UPI00101C74D2|nr:phosphatase PAP2 family protein [Pedobacter sp. SYP-B3415]